MTNTRYALCIGNNEYNESNFESLRYAVDDAKAVAEKLGTLGFDADTAFNLNSDQMAVTIGKLEDKVKVYDALLFFYAGHGFQFEGENILVPVDVNTDDEKALVLHKAYKVSELMDLLERADSRVDVGKPKTKIVILDACRTQKNLRGGTNSYFAPISAPQGSIIAFSTSPGQASYESNGHGAYTSALLRYMDAPRVTIERVFKRVRTYMVNESGHKQIPWEHTSLVGDFYLNPNTIYDATVYSEDALADSEYVFKRDSKLKGIVEELKSHNYYTQQDAIRDLKRLGKDVIDSCSPDELFILGRNIYQAACGGCWDCQSFIENFADYAFISDDAKPHILNGMAFEVYYSSNGELRKYFKSEQFSTVSNLLEREEFYGCSAFIASKLENEDNGVFYIPGQDDKVEVTVKLKDADDICIEFVRKERRGSTVSEIYAVEDILFNGHSIYYSRIGNKRARVKYDCDDYSKKQFEALLRNMMAIANGYLKVNYIGNDEVGIDSKTIMLIPYSGFQLFPDED